MTMNIGKPEQSPAGHNVEERKREQTRYEALGREVFRELASKIENKQTAYLLDASGNRAYRVETNSTVIDEETFLILEVKALSGDRKWAANIYIDGKIKDADEDFFNGKLNPMPITLDELSKFYNQIVLPITLRKPDGLNEKPIFKNKIIVSVFYVYF